MARRTPAVVVLAALLAGGGCAELGFTSRVLHEVPSPDGRHVSRTALVDIEHALQQPRDAMLWNRSVSLTWPQGAARNMSFAGPHAAFPFRRMPRGSADTDRLNSFLKRVENCDPGVPTIPAAA